MQYKDTTALRKVLALKKRLRIVQGGSSAGKTLAILLRLIHTAQSEKNKVISVVSESMPHLKRGAIRDFLEIMEENHYYKDNRWNRTDFIYTFETGSIIEFFSTDIPGKVRGPRRDILFINEANNISYEVFTQLSIRTNEIIYIDYNPSSEFWVHTDVIPSLEHDFIILTYKDNQALSPEIVKDLESRKGNIQFWTVYGLGQLGTIESRIYTNWEIIDEIPNEAILRRRGLDFGYTNDPTVIEDIYLWNNGFIIDELVYQKGLSNRTISEIILNQPERALTIADSAEPKSIDEIAGYGVHIIGAKKGQGSVLQGIQYVQAQKIYITKRSVKTIKAYRNYLFVTDKNGKIINEPDDTVHEWSNPMDSIRYGVESLKPTAPRPQPTTFGGVARYIEGIG